jgi:hypothetical protein
MPASSSHSSDCYLKSPNVWGLVKYCPASWPFLCNQQSSYQQHLGANIYVACLDHHVVLAVGRFTGPYGWFRVRSTKYSVGVWASLLGGGDRPLNHRHD